MFKLLLTIGVFSAASTSALDMKLTTGKRFRILQEGLSDDWRTEMLDNLNAHRTAHGLGTLEMDSLLTEAAQAHAEDVASRGGWDSEEAHIGTDGDTLGDRATEVGFDYKKVGENVAWNQRTVEEVMQDWKDSDGHNANLLGEDFVWVGFGITSDFYWVQVFGEPTDSQEYKEYEDESSSSSSVEVEVEVEEETNNAYESSDDSVATTTTTTEHEMC